MPKSHRLYPPEFRQRIIELVRKGRTPGGHHVPRAGCLPQRVLRVAEATAVEAGADQCRVDGAHRGDPPPVAWYVWHTAHPRGTRGARPPGRPPPCRPAHADRRHAGREPAETVPHDGARRDGAVGAGSRRPTLLGDRPRLDHPQDRAQVRSGKDVGGNRGELRDPHAEAESGRRVEKEENEILRASHHSETPDPEDRDNRTEHEYPSAFVFNDTATTEK